MRPLVVTSLVCSLAALLAACGKPAGQSGEASAPAAPAPTLEQLKAAQAKLPAPYNTADLENGKAKFAMCSSCHTITPGGPNMTGPNLYGVAGTKVAAVPSYNFSDALRAQTFTWDAQHFDQWISNPRAMVPGTKMTYAGMQDAKDRADVVAYLLVNAPPQ